MKKKHDEKVVELELIVNGQVRLFRYTNKETLVDDVKFIIFLFIERSVYNTFKSIPQVAIIIKWLVEKYDLDINIHAPVTALGPDIVNIWRVMACFPAIVCRYYHEGFGYNFMSFHDLNIRADQGVTRAILCPYFTSLLPRDIIRRSRCGHYMSFLVHILADNVIHRKQQNFTGLRDMFTYYAAAYNCLGTPLGAREIFCQKVGLLNEAHTAFIPVIMENNDWYQARIRAFRPDDPHVEEVMRDLNYLI
jgi:hypothetical protein